MFHIPGHIQNFGPIRHVGQVGSQLNASLIREIASKGCPVPLKLHQALKWVELNQNVHLPLAWLGLNLHDPDYEKHGVGNHLTTLHKGGHNVASTMWPPHT